MLVYLFPMHARTAGLLILLLCIFPISCRTLYHFMYCSHLLIATPFNHKLNSFFDFFYTCHLGSVLVLTFI